MNRDSIFDTISQLKSKVEKVLYVEDELELAEVVIKGLEDLGISVVHATNAMDATAKTRNQAFDLLILDINLDKGTGDSVIESVRKNPKNPNPNMKSFIIPILLTFFYLFLTSFKVMIFTYYLLF